MKQLLFLFLILCSVSAVAQKRDTTGGKWKRGIFSIWEASSGVKLNDPAYEWQVLQVSGEILYCPKAIYKADTAARHAEWRRTHPHAVFMPIRNGACSMVYYWSGNRGNVGEYTCRGIDTLCCHGSTTNFLSLYKGDSISLKCTFNLTAKN